jgi:HSP20 family protein
MVSVRLRLAFISAEGFTGLSTRLERGRTDKLFDKAGHGARCFNWIKTKGILMKLVKREKAKSVALSPVSRAYSPFWPMRRLQSEIDRLFEDPFAGWLTPNGALDEAWLPAVDVHEDKINVIVQAEIPGMKKEEFEVYLSGDDLVIAGERKSESEEKRGGMYRAERYFGRFHRSIPLPAAVDGGKIDAHYKDGVLTISCPKTEEAKPRPIEVKVD